LALTSTAADERPRGIDWLVLPILQYNDDAGLIYGAHFPLVDYGEGVDPYDWYFEIKLRHSTKNRHEHFLLFDAQTLFPFRFTLRGELLRIDDANYFGIGRLAKIADNEADIYHYRLTEPRIQTLVSKKFSGDFLWGAGLSFNYTWVDIFENTLLDAERPWGAEGGHALVGLFTLAYDSRDDELVPHDGLFIEAYAKAATRPLGSKYNFHGAGLVAQGYYSPWRPFVFAQRFMIETLGGEVPFYELARIGGRTNVFGAGGVFTQRGFPESRFIGRSKVLANSEVRYYFPKLFNFVTFGLGAFFDVSTVLENFALRPSGGAEISVKWKELIVFRIDGGISREGSLVYVEGFHMF
jgi:hypothetical protein